MNNVILVLKKMCVCVCMCVCMYAVIQQCLTLCNPMDCSPLSSVYGISQTRYWSRLPFPPPWDLPNPGIDSMSLSSSALVGRFFTTVMPGKPVCMNKYLCARKCYILAIRFLHDSIRVSVSFSQIIPPSPSPSESKTPFYTSVSLAVSHTGLSLRIL